MRVEGHPSGGLDLAVLSLFLPRRARYRTFRARVECDRGILRTYAQIERRSYFTRARSRANRRKTLRIAANLLGIFLRHTGNYRASPCVTFAASRYYYRFAPTAPRYCHIAGARDARAGTKKHFPTGAAGALDTGAINLGRCRFRRTHLFALTVCMLWLAHVIRPAENKFSPD